MTALDLAIMWAFIAGVFAALLAVWLFYLLAARTAQGMPREATRRECGSGASAPASPVANGDAPQVQPQGGDA